MVYPIVENIRLGFFDTNLFLGTESFVGLDNFREIPGDQALRATVVRTIVWTVGSLAGQLALGMLAAVLTNRKTRSSNLVRQLLLIPYVVPTIATAMVWRWIFDGQFGIVASWLQGLNLIDAQQGLLGNPDTAMLSVIFINIWRGFPFAMLIYFAALQNIDETQYEAASLDGAGPWASFRHITWPNLRSATLTLLVLRGIWTIMFFELIWLTTSGGPVQRTEILPTHLYQVVFGEFRFGYAAAVATVLGISLLGMALIYLALRRTEEIEA